MKGLTVFGTQCRIQIEDLIQRHTLYSMQTTNVNVNVNLYSASSQKNASNAVIHNAKVR